MAKNKQRTSASIYENEAACFQLLPNDPTDGVYYSAGDLRQGRTS